MQTDLFDDKVYPKNAFKPLHDLFKGVADVPAHKFDNGQTYEVNLTKGECSCAHGAAMVWYSDRKVKGKWIHNRYCTHKLKAISDIIKIAKKTNDTEVLFAFFKAVATRYNSFEVVSAMHKYIRVGNFERAYFFACILSTTRSAKGVIKYLLAIVYEETRDHNLRKHLSELMDEPDRISLLDMSKALQWFCETPKKWDLHEVRIDMFSHEMRGYQRLVKEFGVDVAKASEIIDADMVPTFLAGIEPAIKKQDWDTLQYCIKGIQKSKFPDGVADLHELRIMAIETLYPAACKHLPKLKRITVSRFYRYLKAKPAKIGISYHDLNAFTDLIQGEPYGYGGLPAGRVAGILAISKLPAFPFEKFPNIPLVAHDNHTYRGKGLLRHHAGQIPFGVEQTAFDLRGCGAYKGVCWRYYAASQKSITMPWHEVKIPRWLNDLTNKLFY